MKKYLSKLQYYSKIKINSKLNFRILNEKYINNNIKNKFILWNIKTFNLVAK